jgi:outer membrane protein assembly factor BamB
MWGFAASPLVTDGLVVVFGGGADQPNLHAYDAESGAKMWSADAGADSYASPHAATLAGKRQILLLCDQGLVSVDPATGKRLWRGGEAAAGAPRSLQPQIIGDKHIVQGTFDMGGVTLVSVAQDGSAWNVVPQWSSASEMKPEFSDLIVHEGHAYGFDGAIFCCLDVATGKRLWKGGRYGRGQALLLTDQGILLVLSEKGEAILVEATPERHHELARIPAISGKTWNHPVIAHGRLFVRNAEEIACFQLPVKQ